MTQEQRFQTVLRELSAKNPELAAHLRRLDELIDQSSELRRKTRISLERARDEVQRLRAAASG